LCSLRRGLQEGMHGQCTCDAGADPFLGVRSFELNRIGFGIDADQRLDGGLLKLGKRLHQTSFVVAVQAQKQV
jgi:hypothetical protein